MRDGVTMHARRPFPVSARASSIGKISVIWLLSDCHVCVPLRIFADLIPLRGRSPWLPFAILRGSGRALPWVELVLFQIAPHSVHPPQSGPSTRYPTFIVVTCFATFVSSLFITWPNHERRFWATYVVIGLTIASLLNFSFLIRSFLVLPWIHLSIFISVIIVYASIEIDCLRLKYVGLCQVGLCCTMEMLYVWIKSAVSWLKMCILSQNTSPVSVKNPRNLIIDTKITKIGQKDTSMSSGGHIWIHPDRRKRLFPRITRTHARTH